MNFSSYIVKTNHIYLYSLNNQVSFQRRYVIFWKWSLRITKEIRVGVLSTVPSYRYFNTMQYRNVKHVNNHVKETNLRRCLGRNVWKSCVLVVFLLLWKQKWLFQGFDSMTCHFLFSCLCVHVQLFAET